MPLDPTQHQLFRRTFLSLLEFVNERLHVIADQRLVHGDEDDISRLGLVARELWNHPELAHVFASEHREELGDDELQCVAQLADALRQLKGAKPINMKQTRDFLVGNKKYIKKKFFKYLTENIDKF
jgi:hypothetical protein